MNQVYCTAIIKYIRAAFLPCLAGASGSGLCDSPIRIIDYISCSSNSRFCAYVSTSDGVNIYRVSPITRKDQSLKITPDWLPAVFVSNDGKTLVAILSTIIPNYTFEKPVIKVWLNGKIYKEYLAKDIVKETDLSSTVGGFHWGEPLRISRDSSTLLIKINNGTIKNIRIFK